MIRILSLILPLAPWSCGLYIMGVAIVSLWPRSTVPVDPIVKEKSQELLPQEGENFKVVDAPVVYRLEAGRRRPYKSAAAFLGRAENPPFGTAYEEGGILLCDSVVLLFYPLGVKMPRPDEGRMVPFNKRPYKPLNEGRPLLRKDKWGHLLVYMGLAILLWLAFIQSFSFAPKVVFLLILFFGSCFGCLLELGQAYYSAGRDAEWGDMLMNVLGLLLGSGWSWHLFRGIATDKH